MIDHFDIRSRLEERGISATPQRIAVAETLLARPQHLTAEQVHAAVNASNRKVSVATVYNTLKLFTARGLLREVVVDPGRVFYDSTTRPHHHFFDIETSELIDIEPDHVEIARLPDLPEGTEAADVQVIVRLRRRRTR